MVNASPQQIAQLAVEAYKKGTPGLTLEQLGKDLQTIGNLTVRYTNQQNGYIGYGLQPIKSLPVQVEGKTVDLTHPIDLMKIALKSRFSAINKGIALSDTPAAQQNQLFKPAKEDEDWLAAAQKSAGAK